MKTYIIELIYFYGMDVYLVTTDKGEEAAAALAVQTAGDDNDYRGYEIRKTLKHAEETEETVEYIASQHE